MVSLDPFPILNKTEGFQTACMQIDDIPEDNHDKKK